MKTFEVIYQAAKARTGLTVQMDVYNAAQVKDAAQSVQMQEIGTTGRYHGSFTADGPDWHVQITDNHNGSAVKHFGQWIYDMIGIPDAIAAVTANVAAVAAGIAAIDVHLTAVEAKIDELDSPPMVG